MTLIKDLKVGVNASLPNSSDVKGTLTLSVQVDDAAVRKAAPGFDGLEKVFALVPNRGRWERIDLKYNATVLPGGTSRGPYVDDHRATLSITPAQYDRIASAGVAFGMDTNKGTLWLQGMGQNFKPHS